MWEVRLGVCVGRSEVCVGGGEVCVGGVCAWKVG